MSDEEGIMLFETARDAVRFEATPRSGKGALGAERAVVRWRNRASTLSSPTTASSLSSCGANRVSAGWMCASA